MTAQNNSTLIYVVLAGLGAAPVLVALWPQLPGWVKPVCAVIAIAILATFSLIVSRGDWRWIVMAIATVPAIGILAASLWQADLLTSWPARFYVVSALTLVFGVAVLIIVMLNQFE